jgi:hypothetical protein
MVVIIPAVKNQPITFLNSMKSIEKDAAFRGVRKSNKKSSITHIFYTNNHHHHPPTALLCLALLCFLLHFLSTSIVECLNSVECNAAAATAQDHQTLFTCVNVYSK